MSELNQDILGTNSIICFPSLGGKKVSGKVDTGANTSSLHSTRLSIDNKNNTVSFLCPVLSNSIITMDLCGSQEVVSADAGGINRPVVKFDIEIGNKRLRDVVFNLNDRSGMDDAILIGQNIIAAGNFLIDIGKDDGVTESSSLVDGDEKTRDKKILEAIGVLVENSITLDELLEYIKVMVLTSVDEE